MSATESIVYGYGFELSITPVIFIKWIKKHMMKGSILSELQIKPVYYLLTRYCWDKPQK